MKVEEEKLYEIGDVLMKINACKCGFEGNLGMALYLLIFSNFNNDERYFDKSIELFEQELSYYSERLENLTFWTGIAGLGWYCNAIVKKHIDFKYDACFDAINGILEGYMLYNNTNGLYYYDYLHGGLGIGHYFLLAGKKTSIASLVDKVYSVAIDDKKTIGKKWKTNSKHEECCEVFNLSLSHGMSSIVVMLSKIYLMGIECERCAELIEGALNYILAQKLPPGNYNSIFGNYALESMEKPHSSRLAWCYGDLGIAMALWRASQVLNRKDWESEAKAILLHASKRRNLKENGVMDACFCHGTSGIAHVFNRMWRETGMPECRDAAAYWISQTLGMAKFKDGYAGFKTWKGVERGYQGEYGLLEGIAGIGLSLLSYIADDSFTWDECLLLS